MGDDAVDDGDETNPSNGTGDVLNEPRDEMEGDRDEGVRGGDGDVRRTGFVLLRRILLYL